MHLLICVLTWLVPHLSLPCPPDMKGCLFLLLDPQ